MDLFRRAYRNLSLDTYAEADTTGLSQMRFIPDEIPDDQYILRMMVRSPWSNGFQIPPELEWLRYTTEITARIQEQVIQPHPFCYVTVRAGLVKSVTDDQWHVDGFSMRTPHQPEQNYIWSNCHPTEVLNQRFEIPKDFDPFRHNIHQYFQDRADPANIVTLDSNALYIIDPFVVHRRPTVPVGVNRCFFRISFVPVEIEDDTCTPNPLLPARYYGRDDIRKTLVRYE